ncbi:DNA polymerase III subunit alpha [Chitinophaga pendula]|uniref:DNA polymerase III subunit alpha n=1 Tax=Chitinophaga TaxID=79328 RepID=UPI000BB08087|nr:MULTISPECIES: DNA polymerase III subunit alpha [Chitinophaga]ASZ14599.1 DNA polymerase III subunit alpha [Chitinophaga sp. MD30]UCJ07748.1 DNA polymerase III subunit alpha [Chitinophaga pendula]
MYLNCKTYFSLRYGTIDTEILVKTARDHGITSLALTNINITSDTWSFVQHCQRYNIKPILGLECRNGHTFRYILLARDMEGWLHINQFLSHHLHTDTPYPERAPLLPGTFVIYRWGQFDPKLLAPHELIGIRPREVNKLFRVDTLSCKDKLVVLQPVTFQDSAYYELHRVLRAVDQNILISQLAGETIAAADEHFIAPAALLDHFQAYPHIVRNTLLVMEACSVQFDFKVPRNKRTFTGSVAADHAKLRELAYAGMEQRYGKDHAVARERIEKELRIVDQLDFNSYFLITWDIIRYARHKGFFYVGRGSGANSIIAYCLHITDVDPIALDLYFERFLNPQRSSPPDFDIDFSWRDRDQIISYVFEKYGQAHTALLGMVSTFQRNAIVRELGKVYGLPKREIDLILEHPMSMSLNGDDIQRKILAYSKLMTEQDEQEKSFPNHLSIHAGGILISEAPIHQYCATYMPPKGYPTAQLDMHQAEAIGLFKFDILSQRGLGHIRDAITMIKENKGVEIDIHDVQRFMQDEQVRQQLLAVNTIGCFYIESPAMRQLLKKLRCGDYLSLVAASSIIRPGVAQSGMMRQYVQRYRQPETVHYLHPIIEQLLKETFGVMVYQEDVIKVIHAYADMDLADADILRRAMAGKYRGRDTFASIERQYFDNCMRLGRPRETSEELWRQISSFSGFSFSKAHSASFAVESYQSLYLKTYFPAEFMVAVINNFGGFYNRELYFRELQRTGVQVCPPCVNNSEYYTRISGAIVYTGFIHLERLEEGWISHVLKERQQHGPYAGLEDFTERIHPAPEQLELLIRIGAFRFTGCTKKELLWKSSLLLRAREGHGDLSLSLFQTPVVSTSELPALTYHRHEDAFDEIDLLGFPLCSPFEVLEHDQEAYITAAAFPVYLRQTVFLLGYLVCTKYSRTQQGEPMCFGTFLDKEGMFVDTVHFPDSLRRCPFQKEGFYVLQGVVSREYDVYTLEINYMRKIGYFEDKVF